MADEPSARDVANSVLNNRLPRDQEMAGTLEQYLRMGDQANPRGGFSYLDNIARILSDEGLVDAGDVLLDQLLGRPVGARNTYGAGGTVKPIPAEPHYSPFLQRPGAGDTTDDAYREQYERYFQLPLDRSVPDEDYFTGKSRPTQRRT